MDSSVFKSLYDSRIVQRDIGDVVRDYARGVYFRPAVQREMSYTTRQKSMVVLSILRGLSIDSVTLVAQDEAGEKFSVCDGAHRLQTLLEFFNGEFPLNFSLTEGEDARSIRGKYYEQLDRAAQLKLKTTQLVCVKLFPPGYTRREIAFAEAGVLRAKNSCAIRMNAPMLKLTGAMAVDEDFAEFKQRFYAALRTVLASLGFNDATIGRYLNKSATSGLAAICADLCQPKQLSVVLQKQSTLDAALSVCQANSLKPTASGNHGCYIRVIFALLTVVIPELGGRYRELVAEYIRQRGTGDKGSSSLVVRRALRRLFGPRDWHYCVGM